jgi:hypothetical protein
MNEQHARNGKKHLQLTKCYMMYKHYGTQNYVYKMSFSQQCCWGRQSSERKCDIWRVLWDISKWWTWLSSQWRNLTMKTKVLGHSECQNYSSNIIFVNNQLDTQFFLMYIYFYSLHVSGSHVPIIRRINCINTTSGIFHSV